jgi:hypothetical protein
VLVVVTGDDHLAGRENAQPLETAGRSAQASPSGRPSGNGARLDGDAVEALAARPNREFTLSPGAGSPASTVSRLGAYTRPPPLSRSSTSAPGPVTCMTR